ncbi:hypothetical protein PR202_gb15056 [Eleusine coracana subsp. coracana]|uniref:TmcB/TmcC TPR repeats domain-containing protein n=1 Tax=Eleusine coracana subsp. coracana TaxID=191504 RepID=A0AAV5EXV5_ELECO|nr:hypothetical protein PR202_gb15056 [Eleusine coracana subsp. coracana]
MLLRSSSTPFLHSFRSSSSPSSLHLRRAFSDGHIPSLHPWTPNDNSSGKNNTGGSLHTELPFSIYNTSSSKGAPLAAPQPPHDQFGFEQQEEQDQRTVQPEQPELPLFLARGLGIDRIASGLFTAGAASKPKMDAQDEKVAALDAQYKKMVDEQPGNALFLRNYAQFLHEVKGDPKRAEEYYSRAMLADPSDGEIMSQYAKLVWQVHHDRERSLSYFQNNVLAAYASFLWEQDDDDFGEGEESTGGAAPEQGTGTGQVRELASAAV